MLRGIHNPLLSSNKYTVRFAQDKNDIRQAQHLRFKVFNLELGEGLESSYKDGLDKDQYDKQCHHLLVIEKKSSRVIGTYRLQTYRLAQKGNGFYTANEFNLQGISSDILEESVEVGRACIDREHRNGRVLFLLWRGIAAYLTQLDTRYLFGCCSITSQDKREAWTVMGYLEYNGLVHPELMVETNEPYHCEKVDTGEPAWKKVELPQLFRLYMDLGARVCSPPAIDREFKTIDYLVILDVHSLDERTKMLFFK